MGPNASLAARDIGMDFAGADGWRMYHGSVVPGFPQHPHRGFETVTFVRQGYIDHSDSLGATARFGRGDVQWLTAGEGIVHCEMFPLLDREGPNPCELFQIWLNLPAADKMVAPYFTMFWDEDIPRRRFADENGRTTEITVIAGVLGDAVPPSPPPSSWASKAEADLAIWHVVAEAKAQLALPPASGRDTVRTLYVFEGSLRIGDHDLEASTGAVVRCDEPVVVDRRALRGRSTRAAGPTHRRARRPVRAVRDERRGGDPPGVRRLSPDGLRRVAMADRRPRARARRRPVRAPRRWAPRGPVSSELARARPVGTRGCAVSSTRRARPSPIRGTHPASRAARMRRPLP